MRAYLHYFSLRIKTELQYRAAAIAGILTQMFFCAMYIMFYTALYKSNGTTIAPMSMTSLASYLWLQQAFFSLTYTNAREKEMIDMIKNGNLAYELVRPQNFYFKFYIKMFSHRLSAVILRALPIIVIGFLIPKPYGISLPSNPVVIIVFLVSIILSGLLINAMCELINITTMFTMDDRGVRNLFYVIADVFTGSIVPLPFFPLWLLKIANILPFKYITDFPYRTYTGDIILNDAFKYLGFSFIWLVVFVLLGYFVSKIALKKAVVQGG